MSRGRKGATGDRTARPRSSGKRRQRPPWGDLLGGKPIERQIWMFGDRIEWGEKSLGEEQFSRMLRLKEHYGMVGGHNPPPTTGVAPPDWLPWYELALRIASDLDDSLKIVDVSPPVRTAARWRGPEGALLVRLVNAIRENRSKPKKPSVRWCLLVLRKKSPGLTEMSPSELEARYYDAKKRFGTTKQARKQSPPS